MYLNRFGILSFVLIVVLAGLTGCDMDMDGVGDDTDNCLMGANADQADSDADGLGDA